MGVLRIGRKVMKSNTSGQGKVVELDQNLTGLQSRVNTLERENRELVRKVRIWMGVKEFWRDCHGWILGWGGVFYASLMLIYMVVEHKTKFLVTLPWAAGIYFLFGVYGIGFVNLALERYREKGRGVQQIILAVGGTLAVLFAIFASAGLTMPKDFYGFGSAHVWWRGYVSSFR